MNNSLKNIDASKNDGAKEIYHLANGFTFGLSNESVTPKVGNQTTQFTFSVIFTNQKNTPPKSINVIINGTFYPLEKQNLTDFNYVDGCIYKTQMNITPSVNNYSYYFKCSNGN